MPAVTKEELWRNLKGGKVEPLYLLFGPEGYLRDKTVREVTDAALKGAALREFTSLRSTSLLRTCSTRLLRRSNSP